MDADNAQPHKLKRKPQMNARPRVRKRFRFLRSPRFFVCLLLTSAFFVALCSSPTPTASPSPSNGGGQGGITQITQAPKFYCGSLENVITHFGYAAATINNAFYVGVPPDYTSLAVGGNRPIAKNPDDYLSQIPAPDGKQDQDLTYTKATQKVCANEQTGKQAILHLLQGQITGPGTEQPKSQDPTQSQWTPSVTLNPVDWIWNGLTGTWDKFWKQAVDFFQHQLIDLLSSYGFVYITPSVLSYSNPIVLAAANMLLKSMDGCVALLLVIGGYQTLLNRTLGIQEKTIMGTALKVALAAVVANLGFWVLLPNIIELSNTLSISLLETLFTSATGDVSLPLGSINWLEQSVSWSIFIIIDFVASLFLILVDGVRIVVLDVTIVFSPLWIMALANDYTKDWGKLGATTFSCALAMQPIQNTILGMGSTFIANWGHYNLNTPEMCSHLSPGAQAYCAAHLGHASISASTTLVTLLIGLLALYTAYKVPGMLFSSAIRASVGAVNHDVMGAAKAIFNGTVSVALLQNQLKRSGKP